MPLYVADYLADTRHLGAFEHGVYLLLIMHYWQTGGLPDEDTQLARIACCTSTEWRKVRGVVAAFFEPGWKHGRIAAELLRASQISEKRRGAAEEMHNTRRAIADANAQQVQTHSPPHSPSQEVFKNKSEGNGGRLPPRHGITSKRLGRIYVSKGTPEWEQYAKDFREVHYCDPEPNTHGGRWFNITGERALPNVSHETRKN
jgi:uncharacterized protein YdaU (DUF1376 family)